MLGQRSPQTSTFEGDQLYLEHVGAQTFYGHLAREPICRRFPISSSMVFMEDAAFGPYLSGRF